MDDRVNIFVKESKLHLDVFRVLFVRKTKDSLMPELLGIFGKDKLMKFLDIFSGATLKIPSRSVLTTLIRNTDIFVSLSKGNVSMKSLADKYDINENTVREINKQVKLILSTYGKGIIGDGKRST